MIESPSNRSMSNTRYLKPGVILKERYKIEDVIGAGGFGITYRAWDPLLQSYVAIKEYYPSGIATRSLDSSQVCVPAENAQKEYHQGLIRFLKEAQDVARFQSEPNIVSIYDFLEENETAYMVMEYLHGCTLKQYTKEHGGHLNTDFIIHICLSVLDALAVVHNAGMIHRDISPENIFICEDLTVKLIDFGAAKQVYMDSEQTISVVLKPGYAPPEQYVKKEKQGPWTDIYALGATLYYAASGQKPEESLGRILEDNLQALYRVNPEIPVILSDIIMKAMSLKAEDRYASVETMRQAVLAGFDMQTRVYTVKEIPGSKKKQRKKWYIGVFACSFFLCIGIGIWLINHRAVSKSPDLDASDSDAIHTETSVGVISETANTKQTEAGTEEKMSKATDSDAGRKKKSSESSMVMHVPSKEEIAMQEESDEILNLVSSSTERVRVDAFTYLENGNRGFILRQDTNSMADSYEGDSAELRLKYYDSLLENPPNETDSICYSFTFERYEPDYGIYKPIYNVDETSDFWDYATCYTPEFQYEKDAFILYVPLSEGLPDGKYKMFFSYEDDDTYESIFQVTIEFYLNRSR